jgi:hypothetical protein
MDVHLLQVALGVIVHGIVAGFFFWRVARRLDALDRDTQEHAMRTRLGIAALEAELRVMLLRVKRIHAQTCAHLAGVEARGNEIDANTRTLAAAMYEFSHRSCQQDANSAPTVHRLGTIKSGSGEYPVVVPTPCP